MAWYGRLTSLFRRKKKPEPVKRDINKPLLGIKTRDTLAPNARTQKAIKDLKASGLSDKEINRLLYGQE